MKIACQSCQAKYTIADEKVLGKVVKIRCKKCSATIVINGNDSQGAEAPQEGGGVLDFTGPASNEQWTVNVADGDQRTMLAAEIVKEYRAGVITDETYCWKDGMADWLPLREIDQLYSVASMGGQPSLHNADPSNMSAIGGGGGGGGGGLFGGGDAPTEERHVNGNGASLFGDASTMAGDASPAPAAAAARRAGGRGGGGADLFGGVAQAGGEEEIANKGGLGAMSGGAAPGVDEKLTGQRNENSVLFSLSALTGDSKGGPPPAPKDRTTAQADGSGLIDIRALSANMSGGDKAGKNHVDDIMNLSGGGAFGAALAAPILAPPPMADIPGQPGYGGDQESKGSKTLLIGLLGGGGLIAVAILAAVILLRPSGTNQNATGTGSSANGPIPAMSLAMADPTGTPGTVATGGAAPPSSAVAAPGGSAAAPADTTQATVPGQNSKAGAPTTQPKTNFGGGNPAPKSDNGGGGGGGGGGAPPSNPTPAAPKAGGTLEDEMRKSAGGGAPPPPPAAAGGTQPFDRGAAAAAIGNVNFQSCKKPDGPTGGGHIQITFGPDGNVQTAVVDQPPFAGTPVGGCIAGKFRGAHVPPFAGSPVKVGKSFTIN